MNKKLRGCLRFSLRFYQDRKLILRLSVNDFKTKYAGSYLGITWAFIQPVITVLVYWFVFENAFHSQRVSDVPFVLWLLAGLVPWFFFSEALSGGTNALIEYQYLVKKVVFHIEVLPAVKVLSALYVHLFFAGFTCVLYLGYGYLPDLYLLQAVYYSFCTSVLVLALCYFTSAVVAFFRDLSQIIGIILQVGVWMTPIMWDIDAMGLSERVKFCFKLNPMYYITSGYRQALLYKSWFWENPGLTLYFWSVVLCLSVIGTAVFKRLKIHFADVL